MNYMILRSKSQGYSLLVKTEFGDQQITKWYSYLGNLKRYVKEANEPCFYKIVE